MAGQPLLLSNYALPTAAEAVLTFTQAKAMTTVNRGRQYGKAARFGVGGDGMHIPSIASNAVLCSSRAQVACVPGSSRGDTASTGCITSSRAGTLTNQAVYELYIGGFCRVDSASAYIYCPPTSSNGALQEQFLVHVSGVLPGCGPVLL
jgi:hypothetical protein